MPPKRKPGPTKADPKAKKAKMADTAKPKGPANKPGPKPKAKSPAVKGKPASPKKAPAKSPKAKAPVKAAAKRGRPPGKTAAKKVVKKATASRGRSASPVKKSPVKAAARSKSAPPKKAAAAKPKAILRSPPPVKRVTVAPKKSDASPTKSPIPPIKKLNFPKLKPMRPRESTPPRSTGRASKSGTPQKTPDKSRTGSPRGAAKASPGRPPKGGKSPSTTPPKPPPKKIFACSICEQVFYSSFELWTHKRDIHENPPLMSPEKAMEVLAAAERRKQEKLDALKLAAKAPKRKLVLGGKDTVTPKKTKATADKDRQVGEEIQNLESETDVLLKKEKIEQLKGKVMQLRKEAGKPAPGGPGKKRTASESDKTLDKLLAEVGELSSVPSKRPRATGSMTFKEKLDLMETELDLELRRLKQVSSSPGKAAGSKIGTSLGPRTAAIKLAQTPKASPAAGKAGREKRESGELSFREEGEISYQVEKSINLEPGEIYLGGAAPAGGEVKRARKGPVKGAAGGAGGGRLPKSQATLAGITPNKSVATKLVVRSVAKAGGQMTQIRLKPGAKVGAKVIGTVKVSPAAKLQGAGQSPPAKQAGEARHVSDAIPELNMELQSVSASGVKTLVKYKCANTTCDQHFTDYEKLRKHEEACAVVDNHSSGTFTCAECGLCFNSQLMLTRHKNQKFGCVAANKRLVPLASKPQMGMTSTMVSCNTCDRFFANTANMHQHARHCTGPQKQRKDSKCPICNKAFESVQTLQQHCLADHNFASSTQVLATGRNKYVPAKGVTCLDCGEWFQARLELIQHKRKCGKEGFAKESFACMICKAKCYTRVSLYDHMKSAHGNDEATYKWLTFSCTACKMIFESEVELEKHKQKKHNMSGANGAPTPVQLKTQAGGIDVQDYSNKVMLPVEVVKRAAQAAKEGRPAVIDLSQAVTVNAATASLLNKKGAGGGAQGKKEILVPTQGNKPPAPMMILDLAKLQQMVSTGKGQVFVNPSVAKQISAKKAAAEWNKERATVPAATAKPATATATADKESPQAKHKPAILRTSPAAKASGQAGAAPARGQAERPSVRMLKPLDKNRMMCMTCKRVLSSMDEIATHSCIQQAAGAALPAKEAGEVEWK